MAAPVVAAGMFVLRWRTSLKIMAGLLTVVVGGSIALTLALVVLMSNAAASDAADGMDAEGPGASSGYPNGGMPKESLCPIPWEPSHYLECNALDSLKAVNTQYRAQFGQDLPVTSAYEGVAAQKEIFLGRYSYDLPTDGGVAADEDRVTWEEVDYVRVRGPVTPIPGKSTHGWGMAVDVDGPTGEFGTAEHQWLVANGPESLWAHPPWAAEAGDTPQPWHFEFIGEPQSQPEAPGMPVVSGGVFGDASVAAARKYLGFPYVWGGGGTNGPTGGGFDCSGLVRYAIYQGSGGAVSLPRTAVTQGAAGKEVIYGMGALVDLSLMQPGDAIAFNLTNRVGFSPRAFDHIGLYIGNGQMIHAPVPGSRVSIVNLKSGYYAAKTWSVRRYG